MDNGSLTVKGLLMGAGVLMVNKIELMTKNTMVGL
jgi:hypothetical protein